MLKWQHFPIGSNNVVNQSGFQQLFSSVNFPQQTVGSEKRSYYFSACGKITTTLIKWQSEAIQIQSYFVTTFDKQLNII